MPYTEEGRYLNNVFARISREERARNVLEHLNTQQRWTAKLF